MRDISGRVAAYNKIEVSEERFRDFASAAADRFWETDENHKFTYVSPENDKFTQPSKELIGKVRWEIENSIAESEEWERYKSQVNARNSFRDFRYRIEESNGKIWYRRVSGVPYYDKEGSFRGYRGTATDETSEVLARH